MIGIIPLLSLLKREGKDMLIRRGRGRGS